MHKEIVKGSHMLLRFVLNNMFSFGEEQEFNMFPAPKLRLKNEHKYFINNFSVLKMASIYGANGAGKSNLIKSLNILKKIILDEEVLSNFSRYAFKFNSKENKIPHTFVVEFIQEEKTFLYGLEVLDNFILTEELYLSGMGIKDDILLFERKNRDNKVTLKIPSLDDEEGKLLNNIIEKNLTKPNKPLFKLLTTLDNPKLSDISIALNWFESTLRIVMPNSKPSSPLASTIDNNLEFKNYVEDFIKSFHVGIDTINSNKIEIHEFFGKNELDTVEKIKNELDETSDLALVLRSQNGDELIVVKEDEEYYVKQLTLEHIGKDNKKATFDLNEESDGTIRLLDLAPAFHNILNSKKVFLVDEIERSIHPLLIKELIRKFSDDKSSNGQLIFTTHESNLLDQSIFRQDEIWFAEKDLNGCTDLYTLSDFKEHNTTDIRKGYLNGRYGSIPFLGNLKDLNWHSNDIKK